MFQNNTIEWFVEQRKAFRSSKLLIAGIPSVFWNSIELSLQATKRDIVCGSATRNPVVDTYRLCEQSAISSSQFEALITAA